MRIVHPPVCLSFDSLACDACPLCINGTVLDESNVTEVISEDPDALRQFLSSLPSDRPECLSSVLRLSHLLEERFRTHGSSEDLDDAITYLRRALELVGPDSTDFPDLLGYLGSLLSTRFDQSGKCSDLDQALPYHRQAIELTPVGHGDLPTRLNNLALSLASRFARYGDDGDLEEAVMNYRRAIELTPLGHSSLPSWLNNLALSLDSRFARYGEDADLDQAIADYRQAIELTPVGHSKLPLWLNNLANSLDSRFDRYGEDADLEEAITSYHQAIGLTPVGHSALPSRLNNFALSLTSRFARYGEDADLEQAITNHRQAIELTPIGHSDVPSQLNNLANSLSMRFARYGEATDLEDAITNYRRGIELTPVGHIKLPLRLSNFACSLTSRFNCYGEGADLEQAITSYRQAIELTPLGHSDLPLQLSNLANSLALRSACYGEDTDLEGAITNYHRAIELTPTGHSKLPARLSSLADSLALRFARYRKDADLKQAIMNYRQAIELIPVGHSEVPSRLNSLALSLDLRFARYGEDADLEEAITNYRQAIELTPIGHTDLPAQLNNLANSLESRYVRYAEDADLEHAISNYRQAIELTPVGHSDLPVQLNNLALSLDSRFARYGEDTDLEEAITNYRQAIELTPLGHIALPLWLNNLALSLKSRFARYGEDTDLEHAITNYRRVIELTPVGHSDLTRRLNGLADSLASRFVCYGEDADLDAAISGYAKGSEVTSGVTYGRFQCAVSGATLAHSSGRLTEALKAYNIAASILPQLVWFGQSVASRQQLLRSRPANLASDAAACAISLGDLERAVELLDHGRSIFWSQAMDIRTDLTDLKNFDAALAGQFEIIARALDAGALQDRGPDSSTLSGRHSIVGHIEHRRRLAEQLECLLLQIRELSGFQNFMKPLPFSQLRYAAAGGPIVILNISSYRCDALIVTVDCAPKLIPLPDLSLGRVSELADNFRKHQNSLHYVPRDLRSCLRRLLPEIWRAAVSPVLDGLGYTDSEEKSLSKPRIWWCPTGPLSFLPIHAAGPYTKSGGPNLLHIVVSSYTNTLSALLHARSQRKWKEPCRMLLIGQAETPGQKPLPSTTKELDVICERARLHDVVAVARVEGPDALQDTILEKLKDATCVHFACHGHQDQTRNGLISALYVHDGPILLPTLASRQLPRADFAFLAACHSASGSEVMPDEAMHIAAGMQVAGFRSVIATMWAMDDSTGPFVAEKVYGRLLRNGPDGFDSTEAAVSLNEAVCALRKVKDEHGTPQYELESWVPFIHIGV
jgi:tetratricopeptide (TPR) repeat protein